jgi:RND family efflux transporter MFP subunit
LICLVCIFAAAGCKPPAGNPGASETPGNPGPPGDAEEKNSKKAEETLVIATALKRAPINSYIEVSADIESLNFVDIYPELAGLRITEVAVDEGDCLKKGDLLARLDREQILLENRQAEVAFMEAQKQKLKAKVASKEAEERHKAARIQEEKLRKDYETTREMSQEGLASENDLAADRLAWEQAASDFELRVLEKETAALDAELAETAAETASITRDEAALKLKRTDITAPIDGCVSFRDANVGMTVTTASRLFTLVDTQSLIANLFLPQEDIRRIRVGMPVMFTCDARPGGEFRGETEMISPIVDPNNGTVKVRVRIPPDDDGFLRPGMFINARVLVSSRADALLITRKAVFYEDEKPCFFVIVDGAARKVSFERGAATDTVLEVTEPRYLAGEDPPLDEGSLIVVVGQDNLKEGGKVKIAEELP